MIDILSEVNIIREEILIFQENNLKNNNYFLLLNLLIFITIDCLRLFSISSAIGIDGYYYILQIDSFLKNGYFYFSTPTQFILYCLASLSFILGNSVLALKIGTILFHFSLCFAIFSILKNLTKNFWLGLLAITICELSSLHLYLFVEYINYLGGISFLLWTVYFSLKFAKKRRIIFIFGALICFLLAVGSHRAIIPISLLLIILTALTWWLFKSIETNNKTQKFFCIAALVFFFIFPSLLVIQPFYQLPDSWQNEFFFLPRFPARLSTFPELLIIFSASIVILISIFFQKRLKENKFEFLFFGTLAFWSLLVTLNPFISSEIGFTTIGGRLRVLAYIQAALIVPAVIWLLRDKYKNIAWYVAIVVTPLMIWSFFNPLPRGLQPDYLARRERLIEGLKSNIGQIESNSIIVADHGEQFVVTAITGIPSQQFYPMEKKYDSVYFLLNLVPPTLLDPSMKIIAKDKMGTYTVLVKDTETFRKRLQSPEVRQLFRRGNRPLDLFLAENGYPY